MRKLLVSLLLLSSFNIYGGNPNDDKSSWNVVVNQQVQPWKLSRAMEAIERKLNQHDDYIKQTEQSTPVVQKRVVQLNRKIEELETKLDELSKVICN